jgi:hypothetical protein
MSGAAASRVKSPFGLNGLFDILFHMSRPLREMKESVTEMLEDGEWKVAGYSSK